MSGIRNENQIAGGEAAVDQRRRGLCYRRGRIAKRLPLRKECCKIPETVICFEDSRVIREETEKKGRNLFLRTLNRRLARKKGKSC